jgi:hypothetical protein
MKRLVMLFLGASLAGPSSAVTDAMSPAVRADVQCALLLATAVGNAKESEQQAPMLGMFFFLGKLKAEAPALNLEAAFKQEFAALAGNPAAEKVGERCDAEIQKQSKDMIALGTALQSLGNPVPPT